MISIIIVNYKQKELLSECIASFYKSVALGKFEIIIVNNSTEDNLDEIQKTHPGIKIINNSNSGFSAANNLAAKHAKGEYFLFLNADTKIHQDFNDDLIKLASKDKTGAIGLGLQFEDGRFQNSFGLFPSFINEYKNRKIEIAFKNNDTEIIEARKKKFSEIKEVDWVSGAAIFINKKAFYSVNGFNENYFLYYEDIDLCFRLRKAGFINYYFPQIEIIHHKGENIRSGDSKKLKKIQRESQLIYYSENCSLLDKLLLRMYHLLSPL